MDIEHLLSHAVGACQVALRQCAVNARESQVTVSQSHKSRESDGAIGDGQ